MSISATCNEPPGGRYCTAFHLNPVKGSASLVVPRIEVMTVRTAKTSAIVSGLMSEHIVPAVTSAMFASG
jgi:hypothetical protein